MLRLASQANEAIRLASQANETCSTKPGGLNPCTRNVMSRFRAPLLFQIELCTPLHRGRSRAARASPLRSCSSSRAGSARSSRAAGRPWGAAERPLREEEEEEEEEGGLVDSAPEPSAPTFSAAPERRWGAAAAAVEGGHRQVEVWRRRCSARGAGSATRAWTP
jgi:hypothetical protein